MDIQEIIDLLEKAKEDVFSARAMEAVDQALTLLKQQPTAGEFRQKVTCALLDSRSIEEQCKVALKLLHEAEDIIDTVEAINKDLLEACDKVRDWLDTSSLQQILVHHTEDTRRHALIMGIASNLERLEAAITKAKKEG